MTIRTDGRNTNVYSREARMDASKTAYASVLHGKPIGIVEGASL